MWWDSNRSANSRLNAMSSKQYEESIMTDKETAMVDGVVAQKGGDLVDQDRAPLSPHVSRGLPVRQLAGLGHHPGSQVATLVISLAARWPMSLFSL